MLVHQTDKYYLSARQQQSEELESASTDAKLSCRIASASVVGQLIGGWSGQYA